MVARVEAILRRSNVVVSETMEVGGIRIDKAAHLVEIDGKPVDLSYKEFELLTYFVENQGIALSREKILNNVWNYDYFGMPARSIPTLKNCAARWVRRAIISRPSGVWGINSR